MFDGIDVELAEPFLPLVTQSYRYKVYYGGRGSAKSWSFARALLVLAMQRPMLIVCLRQFQASIADSVHRILKSQIELMGLQTWYYVTDKTITCIPTRSEFIFKGIHHHTMEIKSLEGADIAWAEEAQLFSEESWRILAPTIRKAGSELWVSFNPEKEDDPTSKRFIGRVHPRALIKKVSWRDNPWLTPELEEERLWMLRTDPDAYDHVWEGEFKKRSDALIMADKVVIGTPEPPENARFFFGADWGFSTDPTVLVRCWIEGNTLFVDYCAHGLRVELEPDAVSPEDGGSLSVEWLFDRVPESRKWPILADSARPEVISHVKRKGFLIAPADKWKGSVEDGIAHLRAFEKIVVHERCDLLRQEARLYSYKVDRVTDVVLPVVVDKFNHAWDAIRYALDGYIKRRSVPAIWAKLGS